jgi:Antitoxin MazE-like
MARSSAAKAVQRFRDRQRTKGLRPVQLWLPDTRKASFAAQVAHDIAAVAGLSAEDAAMLNAFECIANEDLRECG